jgi:hypothetical protein
LVLSTQIPLCPVSSSRYLLIPVRTVPRKNTKRAAY